MNAILPPRIPKKAKRSSRWRSQAHCSFVRSHGCCVPGCSQRPIEVAHIRLGSGTGIGQKPDDWRSVSLCRYHHAEQHRIGEVSFWTRIANRDPQEFVSAFIKASPKRHEIERVMKERGL